MIEKGNLISEGKAKSLYETRNQDELLMVYRDDTSAFDGKKKEALKGKGEINNKFNAHIMNYLGANGIDTHYIKTVTDNESLVHKLDMLPATYRVYEPNFHYLLQFLCSAYQCH